jgi:hypothetical protein
MHDQGISTQCSMHKGMVYKAGPYFPELLRVRPAHSTSFLQQRSNNATKSMFSMSECITLTMNHGSLSLCCREGW